MKQTCILILGMHRSGTSALTGLLNLIGVNLGSSLMKENFANKKGYFENNYINKINEELLQEIGSSWDDAFFDESKLEKSLDLDTLKNSIQSEFLGKELFAIKDPRIIYLFPIYEKVLNQLDIEIKIVIPFRHPVEVANSLQARDGINAEKAMLLWICNIFLAEKHSRNYSRAFVDFDELVSTPASVIEMLSNKIGVDFNNKLIAEDKDVNNFIEPNLRHHKVSEDDSLENIVLIAQKIYSLRDEFNTKSVEKKLDDIRNEYLCYKALFYNKEVTDTIAAFVDAKAQLRDKVQSQQELLENRNLVLNRLRLKEEELALSVKHVKKQLSKLVKIKSELKESNASRKQTQADLNKREKEIVYSNKLIARFTADLNTRVRLFEQSEERRKKIGLELAKSYKKNKLANQLLTQEKIKKEQFQRENIQYSLQLDAAKVIIEEADKELLSIYNSRSWKMIESIKKILVRFK